MPEGVGYGPQNTASIGNFNVIGEHAYAYSGLIQTATTNQDILTFTTGGYYYMAEIQVNSPLSLTNPVLAGISTALIKLNGVNAMHIKAGGSEQADDNPTSERTAIMIAPYTEVVISTDSNVSTADSFVSITIVGRIYGSVE